MNELNGKPFGWILSWKTAVLAAGLGLCLGGCAATLARRPAEARQYGPQTSFSPIESYRVFFFPSKEDLPKDYKITPVAELKSPSGADWDEEALFEEFLKKAGELGANAVVLERMDKVEGAGGSLTYKGSATAYRLTQDGSPDAPNLKSEYKATREPEPPQDKSKVIYSYPGMSSQ